MILDTDVLILLEKEDPAALTWFVALTDTPYAAGFAALELLNGSENGADRRRIETFLTDFTLLWPDEATLDRVAHDYGALRLSHGIGVLDMVIAATAIQHGQDLATFNTRHFRGVPGLVMRQPFTRDATSHAPAGTQKTGEEQGELLEEAPISDVVRTKRLEVVDDTGQARAIVAADNDGSVSLMLLDETGKARAGFLHAVGQQSALVFSGADGKPRANIYAQDSGHSNLTLFDQFGNSRIAMLTADDGVSLSLFDPRGATAVQITGRNNGHTSISLLDDLSRPHLVLQLLPTGETQILGAETEDKPNLVYYGRPWPRPPE